MRCLINPTDASNTSEAVFIQAPPSKSIAHRMLICAALSDGVSHISGLELSDDIKATLDCLKKMGAFVKLTEQEDNGSSICPLYTATINGIEGLYADNAEIDRSGEDPFNKEFVKLDCKECGSTLRFLIPVSTLLFAKNILHRDQIMKFTGEGRLLARPLDVYDTLFKYTFVSFVHNPDCVLVSGSLRAGDYKLEGNVSSQFITGLLLTLPMLEGNSRVHIIPPVESRPYINITIDVLKEFGVEAKWEDENTIFVPGNQRFKSIDKTIEGDWSNGAILYTLAVLQRIRGRNIVLTGLRENSPQGDKAFISMMESIDKGDKTVDISDCPDLGPILMAYLAMKGGGTLTGTSRLSIKESDRGHAMKQELEKMGATVTVEGNDIHVLADNGLHAPTDVIKSHNDHRIAMSMAVLCSIYGGSIDDAEAVNKSFPSFFDTMRKVGIDISC